jgi:uncharacterized membrane protein
MKTMLQKLKNIYPLQFEALPLFMIILIFYIILSNLGNLPETIPTHFNSAGLPDGWGNKYEIFVYAGVGLFFYVFITGVSVAMAIVRNPTSFINLPGKTKDSLSSDQADKLRIFLVQYLFLLKTLILGLNVYLAHSNIEVVFQHIDSIGYWPMFFVAAIAAVTVFMVYKSYRLSVSTNINTGSTPYK